MNFSLLSFNFALLSSGTCTWVILPKTLRWVISVFLPIHASCGVLPYTLLVRDQFDN